MFIVFGDLTVMIVKITQMKFTEGLFLILHNVNCATKLDDLIML